MNRYFLQFDYFENPRDFDSKIAYWGFHFIELDSFDEKDLLYLCKKIVHKHYPERRISGINIKVNAFNLV